MRTHKWKCRECDWKGDDSDTGGMLRAPNPFHPAWELVGCPGCRQVDPFIEACDMTDCWREACCGLPLPEGYKRLCSVHYREANARLEAASPRSNGPDAE